MKHWEAQRLPLGSPTVTPFLCKCKKIRRERGSFPVRLKSDIVRRTISLCNKEKYGLPAGERLVEFPNVMLWTAER